MLSAILYSAEGSNMHTSFYKSCNIIHHGDFGGEIYIRNENCDDRVGNVAEIVTTAKTLILLCKNTIKKPRTQILPGTSKESPDKEITVLFKDIEDFVKDILLDKITSKLETNLTMDTVIQVAESLKIKI